MQLNNMVYIKVYILLHKILGNVLLKTHSAFNWLSILYNLF